MLSRIGTVILLLASLDPALPARKSPKPALPKIDQNACPFEGCQFGPWTANQPVELFSTWKPERKLIRTIAEGEAVTAVTGIYITYEPAEIEVTAPIPQYGLEPGDKVFGYMNVGEGFLNAWFNGTWVDEFDGSMMEMPDGSGCQKNCNARLVKASRSEWWVELRLKDGAVGWVKEAEKFDGSDSLGMVLDPSSAWGM